MAQRGLPKHSQLDLLQNENEYMSIFTPSACVLPTKNRALGMTQYTTTLTNKCIVMAAQ